jgi:phosphoribosyl 1,2-cyclic phosphodiesterase
MSKLQFSVLASGSKGNAVAVFPGNGPGFLLDCGLSKKVLKKRLEIIGKNLEDISGSIITHLHGDHCHHQCALSFGWRKTCWEHGVPFWYFGTKITPFELSHGGCPCHGFRVDYEGMSLAYLVDTEYVPEESLPYLFDLDAIIIEANYRKDMVIIYPGYGRPEERHLSNEQAACTLDLINTKRLKHVVMAHGSSRNNTPAFSWNAGKAGAPQAEVLVAKQDRPTKMITLMS